VKKDKIFLNGFIHTTLFYKTVCYTLPNAAIGCEIHCTKSVS